MTKTTQEGESLDAKMSAKELASYEWKGMGNEEGRALFEGSEPIKVTVGAEREQKTWYLPKKVLTHHSPFFNAALNGNFAEADWKAVNLPKEDPIAFELWATWLSVGECEGLSDHEDLDRDYVQAWKLGDKLSCPAFKDRIMFKLFDWWNYGGSIAIDTILLAYEGSFPGSKLRQFIVDAFEWDKRHGDLAFGTNEVIALLRELPEFLEDVVRREVNLGAEDVESPLDQKHRCYENPAFNPDA